MTELVRYDAMCRAIDLAYEVDEVKDIRDKALALETYAKQAKNVEAERRACEIRLRAERKAGDLLKAKDPAKGNQYARSTETTEQKTLKDLGISKDQSSKWQQLAGVPEEQFEAALAGESKPTTNGIISGHKGDKPMSAVALWVWGRIADFERDGVLDADPQAMFAEMLPHMQATIRRLGPRVAEWISRCTDDQ